MITMDRGQEIQDLLDGVERDYGVRILFACESGSRAWGFASPDSDYDIRFFFAHPRRSYLGANPPADTIDLGIRGDLDPTGWDVRKAANLLGKSNGAVIEWLHSPIVYREEAGFLDSWRRACQELLSVRELVSHYRGLAKRMVGGKLQGEEVRAKDYLYALRAVLCGDWVLREKTAAPVLFDEVLGSAGLDGGVRSAVGDLLGWKAGSGESERMRRNLVLDGFLSDALGRLTREVESLPAAPVDPGVVDRLFRRAVGFDRFFVEGRDLSRATFTIGRVRERDMLVFDTVAGSHAYGTAVGGSDEDRRGGFVAPEAFLVGLEEIDLVSDAKGDEVYFELGRLVELLAKNNPNALELLGVPEDCVQYRHPVMDLLKPEIFLSKLCAQTFGRYAMAQVRKARGLNKKIVNPEPERRMGLLEFCHVLVGQGSVPVKEWLEGQGYEARDCGLVAARHAPSVYAVFHDGGGGAGYRGLLSPKDDAALLYSSVAKEAEPVAWMACNIDAFKAHCRKHREYWEWVEMRNAQRYQTNTEHGRGYDSKNLMHTLRLLDMAEEIAREGVIRVRRPNREFLLRVRNGEFGYDELVARAEEQMGRVEAAFERSDLPDAPDRERVNALLVEMRGEFWGGCG